MTFTELYPVIERRSQAIINEEVQWERELASAKNYITTPDLKHWTFGKSAGWNDEYHKG